MRQKQVSSEDLISICWWNTPGWTYMAQNVYRGVWFIKTLTRLPTVASGYGFDHDLRSISLFRYREPPFANGSLLNPEERNVPSLWRVDSTTGTALRGVDLFRFSQNGWTNGRSRDCLMIGWPQPWYLQQQIISGTMVGSPVDQKNLDDFIFSCPFWDLDKPIRLGWIHLQ